MKPILHLITILCILMDSATQAGETPAVADTPKPAADEFRLEYPKKDHLTSTQLYQMGPNTAISIDKTIGQLVLLDVVVKIARDQPVIEVEIPKELASGSHPPNHTISASLITTTSAASSLKKGERWRIEGIIVDQGYDHYMIYYLSGKRIAPSADPVDSIDDFYSTVRKVIAKHYPAVAVSNTDTTLTFDWNTQLFKIHEPTKTGEWQDATEQRGPKRGGVFCEIVSEAGVYNGQAEVPQTFDKGYFRVLLLAPYSKRLDRHLHVLLSYPADASKDFLREFTEAVNQFNAF